MEPLVAKIITVFSATGRQGGGRARAILADPQRRFALRAVNRRPDSAAALALARAGAEIAVRDDDRHADERDRNPEPLPRSEAQPEVQPRCDCGRRRVGRED
jgi:hypothetical protein